MKVIVSGKVMIKGEEVYIVVEGEDEVYQQRVADAFTKARDAIIKNSLKKEDD